MNLKLSICAILICLTLSFQFRFENGNQLQVNSSFSKNSCSVTITSQGNQDSTFSMFSQALSPEHGKHIFTHSDKGFQIQPELSEETLLVNVANGNSHMMAIQHKMYQNITDSSAHSHFLPIELEKDEKRYEFLLPLFGLPFSFLQQNSFYRCENVIFSVQYDDETIDISLFGRMHEKSFLLDGKWDWSWRKSDRGYNFARYTRHVSNEQTIIKNENGRRCKFSLQDLKKYEQKPLDMKKYYNFDEIWEWARMIPSESMLQEL